jgi:hypothetical protein
MITVLQGFVFMGRRDKPGYDERREENLRVSA